MSKTAVIPAALLLISNTTPEPPQGGNDELVKTVVGLAQEMAKNASEMHPERNARFIPDTDKVVYVSAGYPIRGNEYLQTLREAYAGRKSQSQVWDKWEVTPISSDAAVFTGWATMKEISRSGEKKVAHFIFTEVFARTANGWKRVIAQKALLDDG
jgi:hypothetical protein